MKLNRIFPIFTALALLILPACFHDEDEKDFTDWRNQNLEYIENISRLTENGEPVYTALTPVWDKSITVYMKWHNEGERNPSEVTPLSTSTCVVKYTLTNIEGDTLDSSASYTCVPNAMVTGFMAALTHMRVNDTVTAVIPYNAGYGQYSYGGILPYSTLIFGIRLESIVSLM